jgi:two-component sensor histidine kinase
MHRLPAWLSKPSPPLRYTAAVLLAVAAQAARLPLDPPTLLPYITYVPFMAVACWFGGFGPGLLTTALCVLECLYFATPPVGSFRVDSQLQWLGLGILLLSGLVKSVLFDQLERVRLAHATAEGVRALLAQELKVRTEASEEVRIGLARELETRQIALESIIQYSPAAIALLRGPDFRFVTVNPSYQALAPGESMTGRTVAEVFPEAAPVVVPLLHIVRDAQTVYHANSLAVPLHRAQGSAAEERYFNFSYVPVPNPNAGGVDVLVVAIEVTEQRKAEQELRAADSELTAIYANAPVVLLVVDEDLRVEKLNDLGVRLTGREMSDLLGLHAGGALGCLNALADPRGCGYGPSCSACSFRLAVLDTLRRGSRLESVEAWLPFSPTRLPEQRCFLVSSAPLSIDHRPKALVCAQEITGLKRVEADLRATVGKLESALTEKTVLLQEVHHRVKNNLAVISSLLNMKADMTSDGPAKVALEESQRRVHSIALIHEHLYGSEHLDRINFAEYAQQLVQVLHSAFNGASARIAIRMDIDPIELGVHLAVPAALILNELLSNALKYAFPAGRNGEIHVTFREWEPGHVELAVEDDGIGSPDLLVERKTRSVGLQIVRILTAQLGGTLEQELRPGTRVVLRFPAVNARRAGQ